MLWTLFGTKQPSNPSTVFKVCTTATFNICCPSHPSILVKFCSRNYFLPQICSMKRMIHTFPKHSHTWNPHKSAKIMNAYEPNISTTATVSWNYASFSSTQMGIYCFPSVEIISTYVESLHYGVLHFWVESCTFLITVEETALFLKSNLFLYYLNCWACALIMGGFYYGNFTNSSDYIAF